MEDTEIVDLYLKRDEHAIKETSVKYGVKLRSLSFRLSGSKDISEECENDTYMKAWETIPPQEPRDYLFPYLGRIIRNLTIDYFRKENAMKRSHTYVELSDELSECLSGNTDVESDITTEELTEIINDFLGSLSNEQRNIFMRRYYFFDRVSDIAREFSISESKAKTMLFRIREKLKDTLLKEGYTV